MTVDTDALVVKTTENLQNVWDNHKRKFGSPNDQDIEDMLNTWLTADEFEFGSLTDAIAAMRLVEEAIDDQKEDLKEEVRRFIDIYEDTTDEEEWNEWKRNWENGASEEEVQGFDIDEAIQGVWEVDDAYQWWIHGELIKWLGLHLGAVIDPNDVRTFDQSHIDALKSVIEKLGSNSPATLYGELEHTLECMIGTKETATDEDYEPDEEEDAGED